MLKNKIELVRDGERQVLLTWHKCDDEGETIPIAMEFSDAVDEETRERITAVCKRPVTIREGGKVSKAFSGSSKHFVALPKILARFGFRVRLFS
ncbi:MAG: hypothetical protein PF636_10675 [Actinomycetota bacterium]|nr:hypothetical protein [Actinomycetota bacterium]